MSKVFQCGVILCLTSLAIFAASGPRAYWRIPMPRRFGPIVFAALLAVTSLSFNPEGDAEAGKSRNQVDVLIAFKQPPGPNEHALIRKNGGTVKQSYWIVPAVAARVPAKAIAALQKNPNVDIVEPDGLVQADDRHYGPRNVSGQVWPIYDKSFYD